MVKPTCCVNSPACTISLQLSLLHHSKSQEARWCVIQHHCWIPSQSSGPDHQGALQRQQQPAAGSSSCSHPKHVSLQANRFICCAKREREACCTPTGLDAKENVQPASCVFTFSSRRPPCLDTRKLVCLSHIHSSAEAVPSPVNRQSLYLTTATEAYDHVSMRGKGEANACRARFGRLAPTAPEANTINTGHRVQALVTAAKAASSVASNDLPLVPSPVNRQSLYPTTATEASNHVSMRYTDEAKACHAQFSRSSPTAPEANNINTGHRVQALVTAAKPASSVASNSLLPLVPSPVNRQSLYLTTATEASNRVSIQYKDEAKACHAQFSRSAPTAPEANNINTGNRVQALVTAAKVASSVARNSLLPLAVIGADTSESSCTSSAANVKYHITTNMAATIEDCGGCHAPTAKNVHMKDSIAAIR